MVSRTWFLERSILSIVKPAKAGPWGRLYYYENETKISSQFKAVHESIHITRYDELDADAVWKFGGTRWNIGGFQNSKRTDAARKIRRNLGNGIQLKWSKVRDFLIESVSGKNAIQNDADGNGLTISNESAIPIYIESSLHSLKTSQRIAIIQSNESTTVFEMKDFSGTDRSFFQ